MKIIKTLIMSLCVIFLLFPLIGPIMDLQEINVEYAIVAIVVIIMSLFSLIIVNRYVKYKLQNKTHPYPAKFENFYNKLCQQDFEALSKLRNRINIINVISTFMLTINLLFFVFGIIFTNILSTRLIILLICLAVLILGIFLKYKQAKLKEQYVLQYKQEIIRYIINEFGANLEYNPNDTFGVEAKEQYKTSKFSNRHVSTISSKDYIVGRMHNTYVEMCDIITYNEDIAVSFSGVFAVICNKININSQIEILNVVNPLDDFNAEYLLDNNEFEKYFSVKAEDRILATRILTHDVTSMLLDLYTNYGIRFDMTIKNSSIYIRFPAHHIFKIDVKNKVLDKQQIYEPFVIIQCIDYIIAEIIKSISTLDI